MNLENIKSNPRVSGLKFVGSKIPFIGLYTGSVYVIMKWFSFSQVHVWFSGNVLVCLLVLFSFVFLYRTRKTEDHLIIRDEAIPWSNIDHITIRESEYGNRFMAVYFRDDTPPKGFDIDLINNKGELIRIIQENAEEKGYTFTSEIDVETIVKEREKPKLFEVIQKEEKEKEEKKPEITLSPAQKSFAIIFLAVVFFLGIYLVFGMKMAVSLLVIILVHESGHLIALKWFHLEVHGVFFIPFVGAGVLPKEELPSPEVEAAVALAGPAAAVVLNSVFWGLTPFISGTSFLYEVSMYLLSWNFAINLINLMPILPLDGGRIVRAALLRGRKSLIPVLAITVGTGLAVGVFFGNICFPVIALIGLVSLVQSYKKMKEVHPPAWWESLIMLVTWVVIIFLLWATLPPAAKVATFSNLT